MEKELFDWFFKSEKTFTVEEVKELLERVKWFNAGAVDEPLSEHVDMIFGKWLVEKKENN